MGKFISPEGITFMDETTYMYYKIHNEKNAQNFRGWSLFEYAPKLYDFIQSSNIETIMDYGCGRGGVWNDGHLHSMLKTERPTLYDPAYEKYMKRPSKTFDLVICSDVLEHIEPTSLQRVWNDILSYADKAIFLVIHTKPAGKFLPDGRNCHLIQKPREWWYNELDLGNCTQHVALYTKGE